MSGTHLFLLNWLLQVSLVTTLALTLSLMLRQRSSPLRHAVPLSGLLLVLVSPVTTALLTQTNLGVALPYSSLPIPVPIVNVPPHITAADPVYVPVAESVDEIKHTSEAMPELINTASVDQLSKSASPSVGGTATDSDTRHPIRWGRVTFVAAMIVWGLGTLVSVLRLVRGVWILRRLRASLVDPRSPRLADSASRAAELLKLAKPPVVNVSPLVKAPVTVGIFRPIIVFSTTLEGALSDDEVMGIVLHESAHIVRRDSWVGLLQRIVDIVLWWHPLVRLLNRVLSTTREEICDNYVIRHQGGGESFAECLVRIAETGFAPSLTLGGLELISLGREFEDRVQRLLRNEENPMIRLNKKSTVAVALFVALTITSLSACNLLVSKENQDTNSKSSVVANKKGVVDTAPPKKPPVEAQKPAFTAKAANKLFAAMEKRDWESIRASVVSNPALVHAHTDREDEGKRTPLHLAVLYNRQKLARFLVAKGADLHALASGGNTPLHCTAMKDYKKGAEVPPDGERVELVRFLVSRGANVHKGKGSFEAPLHKAIRNGYVKVAVELITLGSDVNEEGYEGERPLHIAAEEGHLDLVQLLVKKHAKINAMHGRRGPTALHKAARKGHLAVVKFLVGQGAAMNDLNNSGTPLHSAAAWGQLEVLKFLLKQKGADLHVRMYRDGQQNWLREQTEPDGDSLLHLSARGGYAKVVEFLLDEGIPVHAEGEWGKLPLYSAAEYYKESLDWRLTDGETVSDAEDRYKEVVTLLLARGADVNGMNDSGETALHVTAQRGHGQLARILLARGARVDLPGMDGRLPLHEAVRYNHQSFARLLLLKGADINALAVIKLGNGVLGGDGTAPLHMAAERGNKEMISLLLQRGANIEAVDNNGRTPLYHAAEKDQKEVVKLLLARGAKPNNNAGSRGTALHASAFYGHLDVAAILLKNGADVNVRNAFSGRTPLHMSVGQDRGVAAFLLAKGAKLEVKTKEGFTPFLSAVVRGTLDVVKYLADQGANVNARLPSGGGAIHILAQSNKKGIIAVLLAKGVDVNTRNNKGQTPLHVVAFRSYVDDVKLVLDQGASVNAKDNKGMTPLSYVKFRYDIMRLLIMRGADVNVRTRSNISPLYRAVTHNKLGLVLLMLNRGADINSTSYKGNTPLHVAVSMGYAGMVQLLLEVKADLNVKNDDGETPMDIAKERDRTEIAKMLQSYKTKNAERDNAD